MNEAAVGRHFVDEFAVLPAPEDPAYPQRLLDLARRTRARVVLPQTTREVLALSRTTESFASEGIAVAVSRAPHTEHADDKWALIEECNAAGIPAPRSALTRSRAELRDAALRFGYPEKAVVAKLPHSNGMRGLRVLTENAWDAERFVREKPDGTEVSLDAFVAMLESGSWPPLVVSEFLPGPEYTVDLFRGGGGATAVVRLRQTIRSGITFDAQIVTDSPLAERSAALAARLQLTHAFGFQWKEDESGVPRILECNPRVQGTMVASALAGVNVIWCAVRETLGEGPTAAEIAAMRPRAIRFRRFWGGGAEADERFVEI